MSALRDVSFLLGAVLIAGAVAIRMRLEECPAVEALEEAHGHHEAPVKPSTGQAIATSKRNIGVGIGPEPGRTVSPSAASGAVRGHPGRHLA